MLAFGFDPDLHHSGWAIVDSDGPSLHSCGVIKVPGQIKKRKIKGREAAVLMAKNCLEKLHGLPMDIAVIEGQQYYLRAGKKKAKPQDLITLGHVSGSVAGHMSCLATSAAILLPGEISSVPKPIRQSRAFTKLGIPATKHTTGDEAWMVPDDLRGMTKTDWKHVSDAVAIAYLAATDSLKRSLSSLHLT